MRCREALIVKLLFPRIAGRLRRFSGDQRGPPRCSVWARAQVCNSIRHRTTASMNLELVSAMRTCSLLQSFLTCGSDPRDQA